VSLGHRTGERVGRLLSSPYIEETAGKIAGDHPEDIARRVVEIAAEHERWRAERLNLLASDNTMSAGARRLLDSDLATRISEGVPGARDYPPSPINRFSDEIEATLIGLVRRLFGAAYVEWRPQSTSMANLIALAALTEPGDAVMVQADYGGGGNFGYQAGALPAVLGLEVVTMAAGELFGIDLDRVMAATLQFRPRVLLVGGGSVLFPYPLRELAAIASHVDARLVYDAAHVGILVAFGQFQDPLREGADALTTGTHKICGGPVGGLVLTQDEGLARRFAEVAYPGLIQTRDQNKFAAAAYALAEMAEFGSAYAAQAVRNAQSLAGALAAAGFDVAGAGRGFTRTHQVFVNVSRFDVPDLVGRLIAAGLLVQASHLPGADGSGPRQGMRLSVQEATRRGLKEDEMELIASWFVEVALERVDPARVFAAVAATMGSHRHTAFSFHE
jgi:glycine hydroxymethyltransferase